ncbi:unnamed protein product [Bursaphelenchus okinawaensis]|uniref:Medium-chain acyl-CoA ligase ACSF2, mitochondrial n=1 Tax=Bursaphelenchus okinawaensis TaxID=465554 RepID=A0A811K5U4_9BILA|nr:unnamed protein product [Bursaphelenchus okinawaensis]CAG9092058.1 unnamed protein product [Bursaphelenchus okinawaensis]
MLRLQRPLTNIVRYRCRLSYEHGASATPLVHKLIGDVLLRSVEHSPDKEYVVFSKQNIRKTYEQFYQDACRLAKGLLSLGLRKGDRIGIWGPNYYEWTVTNYAASLAGMITVTVNPAYQTEELRHALLSVGVKALVTPPKFRRSQYYETLAELMPSIRTAGIGEGNVESSELPEFKHLIVFDKDEKSYEGAWNYRDIMMAGGSKERKILESARQTMKIDDAINIQYTSGTTGLPKAATLTHHNLVNNAKFLGISMKYYDGDHKICIPCPLYHCFGCVMGLLSATYYKQTCIFLRRGLMLEL